ncbi:MAG TPA: DUF1080 domain-containing protein [Planctomycetota bacterium]|nr:DUF1080 domain-containing protein [Planctomycetota bacterium]
MKSVFPLVVAVICVAAAVCAQEPVALIQGTGLEGWKTPTNKWMNVGEVSKSAENEKQLVSKPGSGIIVNGPVGKTSNLVSTAEFGDVEAHIEWMVPKGSNSGVYFMGRYEIQVFDSFGKANPQHSDAGGIYQRWDAKRGKGKEGYEGHPPKVNASKAPGEWQSFDVIFRAPRFDAEGKKIENAKFIKVVHNGQTVHENVEITGPTRSSMWEFEPEKPTGPLMLQGDHGPVAYRNITLKKVDLSK